MKTTNHYALAVIHQQNGQMRTRLAIIKAKNYKEADELALDYIARQGIQAVEEATMQECATKTEAELACSSLIARIAASTTNLQVNILEPQPACFLN